MQQTFSCKMTSNSHLRPTSLVCGQQGVSERTPCAQQAMPAVGRAGAGALGMALGRASGSALGVGLCFGGVLSRGAGQAPPQAGVPTAAASRTTQFTCCFSCIRDMRGQSLTSGFYVLPESLLVVGKLFQTKTEGVIQSVCECIELGGERAEINQYAERLGAYGHALYV